jgi:hypothetical protein
VIGEGIIGGVIVVLAYAIHAPIPIVLLVVLIIGWNIFMLGAIWQAAAKYEGRLVWKRLAQLSVVCTIPYLIYNVWSIASGKLFSELLVMIT